MPELGRELTTLLQRTGQEAGKLNETAAVFQLASEGCDGAAKELLLALADNWDKDHEPLWTPEVIAVGKDDGASSA